MLVKCWLAGWANCDLPIKNMLGLSRQWGKDSLNEYVSDDFGGITLSQNNSLVLSGGRRSIIQFLFQFGEKPIIKAGPPLYFAVTRKHKTFGKNETCVKLIGGRRKLPNDGGDYQDLAKYVQSAIAGPSAYAMEFALVGQVSVRPIDLAHTLQRVFGKG